MNKRTKQLLVKINSLQTQCHPLKTISLISICFPLSCLQLCNKSFPCTKLLPVSQIRFPQSRA